MGILGNRNSMAGDTYRSVSLSNPNECFRLAGRAELRQDLNYCIPMAPLKLAVLKTSVLVGDHSVRVAADGLRGL